jgi:hypothetical protein
VSTPSRTTSSSLPRLSWARLSRPTNCSARACVWVGPRRIGRFGFANYSPGGLLLGAGFIEELYVHMGYHPAWKSKTVLELTFDDGRLDAVHDRSEPMAQRRAAQGSLTPTDLRDLDAWIDITFDHSYFPMW